MAEDEATADRDRVEFWRPSDLTGIEVIEMKSSPRLVKLVPEDYLVSYSHNPSNRCADLCYRGSLNKTPGQTCFFVQPGEPIVARRIDEPVISSTLFISQDWVRPLALELLGTEQPAIKAFISKDRKMASSFLSLHSALHSPGTMLDKHCALQEFLTYFLGTCFENTPRYPSEPNRRALKRSVEYMNEHYRDSVKLEELAQEAGLSKWHFIVAFKKVYGLTPHNFLNMVRLEKARAYLNAGKRYQDFDIGFGAQSLFILRFKEAWGLTPVQYQHLLRRK